MHGHHGSTDQANRVLYQRLDHLLAPVAANQIGFDLLVGHLANSLRLTLDQFRKGVKVRRGAEVHGAHAT
jgi:hypothetical protein